MNWFSKNKFFAGLLVFFVVGAGGAGYYLAGRYGGYKEAMDSFDLKRNRITSLKRKPLYPSEANVKLMENSVTEYEQAVTKLQEELLKFQKPLNTSMKDTEFQQLVKERVEAVQKLAGSGKVELPENFYMGFLKYRLDVPEPGAVGLLDYELKATERLMEAVVRSEIAKIVDLQRDPLAIELEGYEEPKSPPVLEKYPIKLTLSGSHESIRSFFNDISNDREYFYNIRFFRLENSAKTGPLRGEAAPSEDEPADPNAADAAAVEEDNGLNYDAEIVMGKEDIEVYAVIDLVRFVEIK